MNQAITDALVPFETAVQRDAAIAAALAAYYTSVQTDAAIAAAIAPYYTSAETDAAIAAAVALSNGQSWTGGPTFNLLRGGNVLRNLSVAGALTATFQNLDDTILIESDSYARSETYTQLETGAAITAAIDALDLSQFQNEAEVLALIAAALVPYWDQLRGGVELRGRRAGQLRHQQLGDLGHQLGFVELRQQQPGRFQDHHRAARLLHAGRSGSGDCRCPGQRGPLGLLHLGPDRFPLLSPCGTGLSAHSHAPAVLDVGADPNGDRRRHRRRGLPDPSAGGHALLRGQRQRELRVPGAHQRDASHDQGPPAPLAASTILTDTTLELTCDAYTKAESDGRYLSSSSFAPLDARYFARNPAVAEGNGLFHLVQEQFTPQFIRSLLFRPPLTGRGILGNFSVIEVEADCWSKAQSDSRYPLVATFNSLGSTVTSIDGRVSTLETDVGAIDGRVTALENSGGVAPTADLTVNSLTATTFVETPQLQSAAGDLQIQNALVTVRKEDGALLASFADEDISLDRDVTVAAASILNATTADITQLTVGSTAATGAFSSNSSVTANLEVVSNLRVEAPLVRCDPTAPKGVRRASWSTTPSWSTGPSPRRPACPTCSSPAAPRGWR